MNRLPQALAAVLLVCGCADVSQPAYRRPDAPQKAGYAQREGAPVSASETISPEWWKGFHDPYLDHLVARAIAGNIDIRILAARTRVADAQIGEARAGALPTLDAGAGASFEKVTGQKFARQFNVGTQVNWDLDVWGKVEKGVLAQKAEFQASEADWRAGYLSMVADVSTAYFQILQLDEQSARQQQALARSRQILATYEAMHANGVLPNTRVLQQRAEINRLASDLLELRRSRDLAGNALATLLGVPAGEFTVPPGRLQQSVQMPPVPAGLPAQLLERRPDIVAAEFRVLEAYNLVGQAKLAQLPSISLTGRGGSASFALTDLLKTFTVGLLPSINLPMFDPGVKARIKTSQAQGELAEEQYRRTVIGAFEEVENALVNLDAHRKQRTELQQQVEQLEIVGRQFADQLREGVVSQLDVFESERSLLSAQLALLANHQQLLADTVTLYKAMGGGWPAVVVGVAAR